jgi:cyclophilin family peptidyl-prolyl cis-trans isomerase
MRIAILSCVAIGLVLVGWWVFKPSSAPSGPPVNSSLFPRPHAEEASPHGTDEDHARGGMEGSLLDEMKSDGQSGQSEASGPVATDEQLEKQYRIIFAGHQQVNQLRHEISQAAEANDLETAKRDGAMGKNLVSMLNVRLMAFEKDLDAARRERPKDATVQWLTGELLMIAGGDPEDVVPYLNRAVELGLKRPELFISVAKVEFDRNHFDKAYQYATKAVDEDNKSLFAWEIYSRTSFAMSRFEDFVKRLDRTYSGTKPEWVTAIRRNAEFQDKLWQRELTLRRTEEKAQNLPLVRLTIEHRVFSRESREAQPVAKATGTGEVVIELFEDEAPAAVANFLSLAESGFYNGTLFHWAEAGHMVVGGDPNTKNDNPEDDGLGGPGYAIPDEYSSPKARGHFRGTISTVQNKPATAGSQFFITLIPSPEFDGHSTAFGRVIQGQEVLDQITIGRTNRQIGEFGMIIPGDRLVKVEVLRKRPHPYQVVKLAAK